MIKYLLSLAFAIAIIINANAQEDGVYLSGEGEMIFSFANITDDAGLNAENVIRWSPVFNFAGHMNKDFSSGFGANVGLAIRNVGFIVRYDVEGENVDRQKFRTYNFGIPVGIKLGRLDQDKPLFLFAGYELEFPLHYKQKTFEGSEKTNVTTGWFSNRTTPVQQSVWGGIQFPQGFALKFKYYLTDFFDSGFTETIDEVEVKPYEFFNAQVFYFSLEWFPFQDVNYYTNKQ